MMFLEEIIQHLDLQQCFDSLGAQNLLVNRCYLEMLWLNIN